MKSLIIDTNNLLYRIYHIIKANFSPDSVLRRKLEAKESIELPPEGTAFEVEDNSELIDELKVPLLLSFFRTLRCYVRDFKPDTIYAVWDKRLIRDFKNFRKQAKNVEYKAQRDYSEIKLMHAFDDVINDMILALGIKTVYPRVMEGDDVIAWLSHNLPGEKVVVSVDQDFLQLVNEQTAIYSPIKKVTITQHNLSEHTKVDPNVFVLYKAIMGDVGDNVQGLTGFGKVKAKKLAEGWEQYQSKLTTEQLEIVNRNLGLMDLSQGYSHHEGEVESYQEQLQKQEELSPDFVKFKDLCKNNHLGEIITSFSEWISPFRKVDPVASAIGDLMKRLNIVSEHK